MEKPYIHPACGMGIHGVCKGQVWDNKRSITCHCDCHTDGKDNA